MGNPFPYTAVTANVSFDVTPSDSDDLPGRIVRLVAGTTGAIKVDSKLRRGEIITANQMTALGDVLDLEVTRVYSTGTTASGIRAFGIWLKEGPGSEHLNSLLQENVDTAIDSDFILLEDQEFSHLIQE